MTAELDLDPTAAERAGFGHLHVLVAWDEVRGWHFWPLDGDEPGQHAARVEYLGSALLPRPAQVVDLVRQVVIEDRAASAWTERHYRDIGTDDDLAGQLPAVLDGGAGPTTRAAAAGQPQ